MPNIIPDVIRMIAYEDGFAALDWLARVFGFRERTRMSGKAGRLARAALSRRRLGGTPLDVRATTAMIERWPRHGPGDRDGVARESVHPAGIRRLSAA